MHIKIFFTWKHS